MLHDEIDRDVAVKGATLSGMRWANVIIGTVLSPIWFPLAIVAFVVGYCARRTFSGWKRGVYYREIIGMAETQLAQSMANRDRRDRNASTPDL